MPPGLFSAISHQRVCPGLEKTVPGKIVSLANYTPPPRFRDRTVPQKNWLGSQRASERIARVVKMRRWREAAERIAPGAGKLRHWGYSCYY